MRYSIVVAIAVMMGVVCQAADWEADPVHSSIGFSVRHMMVSNVKGTFTNFSGTASYDPANTDVASRLKNPPTGSIHTLLGGEERTWEMLTKAQVEERLGYPVTELPRDEAKSDLPVRDMLAKHRENASSLRDNGPGPVHWP